MSGGIGLLLINLMLRDVNGVVHAAHISILDGNLWGPKCAYHFIFEVILIGMVSDHR